MKSLQDTQTIEGSSKGGSVSGGMQGLTGLSVNAGSTSGEKAWVTQTTGMNASNSANIQVAGTTTLTGASISNVDENGVDRGNLNFTTGGLVLNDIKDKDTYDSSSIGIGVSMGDSTERTPSLNSVDYTSNTVDKEQTTHATIGKGSITTGTTTCALNRDTSNMQELTKDESDSTEFYVSQNSINLALDASGEIDKLNNKLGDVGLAAHVEILENLPTGKGKTKIVTNADGTTKIVNVREDGTEKNALENFIDDTIGEGLDTLAEAFIIPEGSDTKIFLGVGQIDADVNPNSGLTDVPMALGGTNKSNPITSFNLRLTYNDKGTVTHVQNMSESNSNPITIDEWNARYENKSPQASKEKK